MFFYESKSCLICRMVCVVTIYLFKHSIKPVFATLYNQYIQSCTPLVNTHFSSGSSQRFIDRVTSH